MEQMKELIFSIFDSVSTQAMKQGYSVTIRYEEDALTLSAYPIKDEEDKTIFYADCVPVAEFNDADEEEEADEE